MIVTISCLMSMILNLANSLNMSIKLVQCALIMKNNRVIFLDLTKLRFCLQLQTMVYYV